MTRILGIDPGSQRTGIGIIDALPDGRCVHVFHTALHLLDNETFHLRLKQIYDEVARSWRRIGRPRSRSSGCSWRAIRIRH
jgi:Holliday junction resolvasome RuvABC endonuclease subunit